MNRTAMSANPYRDQFAASGLETASNNRILVMCFDRLDRDLATADEAIRRHDHESTNAALDHAQELLGEMATMLDVDAWEHAGSLLAIYDYVLRILALANIRKDAALVAEAQRHLGEIGEAVRVAARTAGAAPVADQPTGGSADGPSDTPRFSVRA